MASVPMRAPHFGRGKIGARGLKSRPNFPAVYAYKVGQRGRIEFFSTFRRCNVKKYKLKCKTLVGLHGLVFLNENFSTV